MDHGEQLANQASAWPTATAKDAANAANATAGRAPGSDAHSGETLIDAIRLWTTPKTPTGGAESRESRESRNAGGEDIEAQAQRGSWATATATDHKGSRLPGQRRGQLSEQVEASWRTPAASAELGYHPTDLRDADGGPARLGARGYRTRPDGSTINSSIDLGIQAVGLVPFLPAPETVPHGQPSSSTTRPSRLRLNPVFVTWMMGFPRDWFSAAEPTNCEDSGTPSCPSAEPSPSLNCGGD